MWIWGIWLNLAAIIREMCIQNVQISSIFPSWQQLEPDEYLVLFAVSALFTSIPVDKTLEVVGELLKSDTSWKKGRQKILNLNKCLNV